jgi:NAD(P)-dependent dehydrogenase (short-subunit alcohol dehydrogenase family)
MAEDLAGPDFAGRAAIVTGAGKGLGRAYSHWLAARGCAVVVSNRLAADGGSSAQEVVAEIRETGGRAIAHDGPVEAETSSAEMVELCESQFGPPDILVANAGVQAWRSFSAVTLDEMRRVLEVNLWGCILGLKAVWPGMTARRYGRIVLAGSSAGLWGQAQSADYGASKGALIGLARSIALDVPKGADIQINVVAPAAYTPMSSGSFDPRWAEYASPDRVAPVVGWLASSNCRSSGGIYHAGAGHVRRVQILEGPLREIGESDIGEVMHDLPRQREWTSSFASGAEIMPEMSK